MEEEPLREIRLSPEDVAAYAAFAAAGRLAASVSAAFDTAPVDLDDLDGLRAHLVGAHGWAPESLYRDETDADDRRMDPVDWEVADAAGAMPAMSLRDLLVVHADDHGPDEAGVDYRTDGARHEHLG